MAFKAGKALQVVHIVLGPPHNLGWWNGLLTSGAFCTKPPTREREMKDNKI